MSVPSFPALEALPRYEAALRAWRVQCATMNGWLYWYTWRQRIVDWIAQSEREAARQAYRAWPTARGLPRVAYRAWLVGAGWRSA